MPNGGRLTIKTENANIDRYYSESYTWAKEGSYVLISIADSGCGMDREILTHIFEPFFTTKKAGEGTGLGLSMVYGIVKQHNGLVHAYSEAGKGSTFKVYLPISDHLAHEVDEKVYESAPRGTETILLAEDEELVRDLAAQILRSAGYTVIPARDGEEAMQLFEKHGDKIDLALLDVVMPRLGGRDVQKQIHDRHPRIRFLFASGYSANAIHTNFVLNQGMHFIQKPYPRSLLLKKIREALDR